LIGENGKLKKLRGVKLEYGPKDPNTGRRPSKEIPGSELLKCLSQEVVKISEVNGLYFIKVRLEDLKYYISSLAKIPNRLWNYAPK
jgi:hypothetical protein